MKSSAETEKPEGFQPIKVSFTLESFEEALAFLATASQSSCQISTGGCIESTMNLFARKASKEGIVEEHSRVAHVLFDEVCKELKKQEI